MRQVAVQRFSFLLIILMLGVGVCSSNSWGAPQKSRKSSSRKSVAKAHRLRHLHQAFVVSADLKPMAQQLLQFRSVPAYSGVAAYAQKHGSDAAGPLAWMVMGYAHYLDKDYAEALSVWDKCNELAPVLGDYLDYLRASAQTGLQNYQAVSKVLAGFEQRHPDSLLIHESSLLYARALIATDAPQRAAAYLEKYRQAGYSDVNLTLAHAYRGAGQSEKAAEVLRHIYFDQPLTAEADSAALELRNLGEASPIGSFDQRRSRALALEQGKRYSQAETELSALLVQAHPPEVRNL
ncbi:MAG TPA: hypothetical protein VKU42_01850, partial [Candidatus Angelobacter sp.]|nr:hypothetical protein [Candidatus Angelobacter sp.]